MQFAKSSGIKMLTFLVAMLALFGVTSRAASLPKGSRAEVKPEFTTFKPKDVPVNWEEIPASNIFIQARPPGTG